MDEVFGDVKKKLAAAEALFSTAESGDLENLYRIFADGAGVWHNTDNALTDVPTSIRNIAKIRSAASEFRYTNIKREPTPSGFVQQHELIIKFPDGRVIRDLCCSVGKVDAQGRISHMEAYHDSAATSVLPHKAPD